MAKTASIAPNRHVPHPFDLKYGTDTGGYLRPDELSDPNSDRTNNGYSAVAPSVFREACRRWRETLPASAARLEAYTFVDVGAGKGRALLLAAELPFRKIIGLEIDSELAAIAQKNVLRWNHGTHGPARIRVRNQDAVEFEWPRSPVLVYLNNPFECPQVTQLALRLAAAATTHGVMDILYVNPACADSLIRSGFFKLLWDTQLEMNEADQLADPYGAAADRVASFRFCRDAQ